VQGSMASTMLLQRTMVIGCCIQQRGGPVGYDPGFLVVVVLGMMELHLLYDVKSDDGRYLLQRRC